MNRGQGASEEQERDRIGPLRTRDMIPGDPHTFSVMITEPWRMWVSHIDVCLCVGGLEDRQTQTWVHSLIFYSLASVSLSAESASCFLAD